MFFAHGSNHSCGVMTLIRKDLDFEDESCLCDPAGRFIILNATVQGVKYIFANIYAPNKVRDQCKYFKDLQERLDGIISSPEQKVVIGGDFNVTFDSNLDCLGGSPAQKESVKVLEEIYFDMDLVDIWRIRNPDGRLFTWKQTRPLIQRRLDFWLISDICQDEVEQVKIIPSIKSDHSAITLLFNGIEEQRHGPSHWKFNSNLTKDEEYIKLITDSVPAWIVNFMLETLSAFNFGPTFMRWIRTFYQNITSSVMNNGFSTGPFKIRRGVRQGDPLSPYLFIICLETLAITVRGNKNIQGILVGKEEIKLEMFADDVTAFLRNTRSLEVLLHTADLFNKCSGLEINFEKTECMFLGNHVSSMAATVISFKNICVKHTIKILGVYFTYNVSQRKKLNFDEILRSIKEKLQMWKWRDLTILGRIQIVKTFLIPIFMYRAGLICVQKDIVTEVNKLLFKFIWKGKDKVKRLSLISDLDKGGLKAPHLESIIKSQRIMCCKKFAENQQSNWKIILSHYMKNVGSKLILRCAFDLKKLCIQLPKYYEECFRCFAEYSVANKLTEQALCQEIHNTVIWNNKFICIQGKSVFCEALFEKGIITLEDLKTDGNDVITGFQIMASASFTPKEKFQLMAIIDAIPTQWRHHLKICNNYESNSSVPNIAQLHLNGHNIRLDKAISKNINKDARSKVEIIPTAQSKYSEKYNYQLDWQEIYCIPFRVTVDSKSREFQFKVLHRYLATNEFLHKIGLVSSCLCTFCKRESETIEHLLIECDYSNKFWQDLIKWLNMIDIKVEALSEIDKIFGIWKRQVDFHLLNHFLILAKQHIYSCRNKGYPPSLRTYLAKVSLIYQTETTIAESNGKRAFHDVKWKKFLLK